MIRTPGHQGVEVAKGRGSKHQSEDEDADHRLRRRHSTTPVLDDGAREDGQSKLRDDHRDVGHRPMKKGEGDLDENRFRRLVEALPGLIVRRSGFILAARRPVQVIVRSRSAK